jgi:hypothetical protein
MLPKIQRTWFVFSDSKSLQLPVSDYILIILKYADRKECSNVYYDKLALYKVFIILEYIWRADQNQISRIWLLFFEVEMIGKKEPEWAGKKMCIFDKGKWVV